MLPTFLYSENILILYIRNLLYKGIVFLTEKRKNGTCEKKLNQNLGQIRLENQIIFDLITITSTFWNSFL